MGWKDDEDDNHENENKITFGASSRFIDGLIASVIATLAVFPLDVIKTRQQMIRPGEPQCVGIVNCFKLILRKEGIPGLYRGVAVVLAMTTPEKALKQVCNEYIRYSIVTRAENGKLRLIDEVLAGIVTGLAPIIITGPTDMIKSQLQDAGRLEKPKMSSWRLLRQTIRAYGVLGLYAGSTATLLREVIFSAGYFPLMEHIKSSGIFGPPNGTKMNSSILSSSTFLSGFVAASLMAWITTPFEVIAARVQMSSTLLLVPTPYTRKVLPSGDPTAKERKLLEDMKSSSKNPFQGAIIHERSARKISTSDPYIPVKQDQAALLRKMMGTKSLPFHLPADKPIRKYTPLPNGDIREKLTLNKFIGNPSSLKPSLPSPIYYDATTTTFPTRASALPTDISIAFEPKPSVGVQEMARSFKPRPSVGRVIIKYVDKYSGLFKYSWCCIGYVAERGEQCPNSAHFAFDNLGDVPLRPM